MDVPQESLIKLPLNKELCDYVRNEEKETLKREMEMLLYSNLELMVSNPMKVSVNDESIEQFRECVRAIDTNTMIMQTSCVKMVTSSTQTEKLPVSCNCFKSKCTKKYCPCFNSNGKCGPECRCTGCMNMVD